MLKRALRPVAAIACAFTIAVLSGCMAAEDGEDIVTSRIGDPVTGTPWRQFIRLNSGEFTARFMADARDTCGADIATPDAEWGDIGSSVDTTAGTLHTVTYDDLDEDLVNCMYDEIVDDPNDTDPEEHRFVICNDIRVDSDEDDHVRNCQSPDVDGDPNAITDASQFFRAAMSTPEQVQHLMVLLRDQDAEDANTGGGSGCLATAGQRCVNDFGVGVPNCIIVWGPSDTTQITANNGFRTQWVRTCPS